jgi:hypothetical protein
MIKHLEYHVTEVELNVVYIEITGKFADTKLHQSPELAKDGVQTQGHYNQYHIYSKIKVKVSVEGSSLINLNLGVEFEKYPSADDYQWATITVTFEKAKILFTAQSF